MLPSQILQKHRTEVLEIMERYPRLSNLRVFGSIARGEDTEDSDVDFLVDLAPGATLFELGGLHEDLEELLGIPVDVISSRSLLNMKAAIERDAVGI
jgi:predicted nucleotidyltransferase